MTSRSVVLAACLVANGIFSSAVFSQGDLQQLENEFSQIDRGWRDTIKELRSLRAESDAKNLANDPETQRKWYAIVNKGQDYLKKMVNVGEQLFDAQPTLDDKLAKLLQNFAVDAANSDDFELGLRLAKKIIDKYNAASLNAPKELYNTAGVSAFNVNSYDEATSYLAIAKQMGIETNADIQREIAKYRSYWKTESDLRAAEAIADDLPRVKFSTTAGDFVIELFENEAPDTVGNFVNLVETNFYDGKTFHRVLPGFMAQGGCPNGNGSGGPGYKIYCETDAKNARRHFRGSLSMAHAGKDTGGSQFFLCFRPQAQLDGKHTVFGRIIEGEQYLAHIQRIDPESDKFIEPTKILSAEVIRKRDHKYLPRRVE